MPRAPKKCGRAGCEERVVGATYCPPHKPVGWSTSTRPGSTRSSRKLRDQVLEQHPVCTCGGCPKCRPSGCRRPSTEDDHVENLAAGGTDDPGNHAGKCKPCHGWKTQQEAAAGRTRG